MGHDVTQADNRIGAAMQACKSGMWAVALFSFCENLLLLAAPLYMMQVYDRVLASRSVDTLIYLTIVLAFALLVLGVLDLARGRLLANVAVWLDQKLSPLLFERAVQSRLRGRTYGPEALSDLGTLRGFVTTPGMTALFDLPWTVIFIAVAYMLHPYFGYLAIGAVILLLALGIVGELVTRKPIRASNDAGMRSRRDLEATSRNGEVIEAMGMMPAISTRWMQRNGEALDLQASILRKVTFMASTTKFVRLLLQSLGLGLGAWLVIDQQASGGVMIASSILMTRAISPIEQSIGAWRSIITVRSAIKRLKAFDSEPVYRPEAMLLPMPLGELQAENLTFLTSASAPPIIKGISFRLPAGEALAVIGPSGAGKSTLARLLAGAVPAHRGLVRLDGADIFGWDRSQVGQYVGYLPQDVELFAGTVSQNISRLREVDAEAVVAAAQMANVHDLILRLPKGYDTEIGEGGQHLSGGQRQRIALARALLGRPRLVIMDEPNSNLDGEGEVALVKAMAALKAAGCTVVVVTHRTALVQHVDKLLILRDGQIEAFGPRQEVFARLVGQPAPAQAGSPGPRVATPGQVVVPMQQGG